MSGPQKIAIIGSGIIGRQWAIIYLSHGYKVCLYDIKQECLEEATKEILAGLEQLFSESDANEFNPEQCSKLVCTTLSLEECIHNSIIIQECVYDDPDLKRELFAKVDNILPKQARDVAILSSTSVHMPSIIFADVKEHKDQCLVAHPVNPPLYVPLVELVAHPSTRAEIISSTRSRMEEVGQKPVVLNKEIGGFAFNRLQYAVLQTAYKLVRDGVMTTSDVDIVVSDGLGPRYAFMGPWMTAHLNAKGLDEYMDKYAKNIYKISLEDGEPTLFEGATNRQLIGDMLDKVPIEKLQEKRTWRDKCLKELNKLKRKLL